MARIEPNMLCLVKVEGEVRGMVSTIRRETPDDGLPMTTSQVWLVRTLAAMQARRLLMLKGKHFNLGEQQMPAGTEGWVSECYLYPLPGLEDDTDTDTEQPKVEEREYEPAV